MVSHKATYLNIRKLGSCNCSSCKLLAAINITPRMQRCCARPHISLRCRPVFIRAYETWIDYHRRRNYSNSRDPAANLLGETQNLCCELGASRFAYLEMNCDGKKDVSFSFIFLRQCISCTSRKIYFQPSSRDLLPRAMKI